MSSLIICQSGGPTSAINSTLVGVIKEARKHPEITKILGSRFGINGVINNNFYEITSDNTLTNWNITPGAILGSARIKLKNYQDDSTTYNKILKSLQDNDVHYFIFIGGNDSMDTCFKIDNFLKSINYKCNVIGLPKTIDNDLSYNYFDPGYPSCAKYIAGTINELICDLRVYEKGRATVIEIMGRDAGWLAASSVLSRINSEGVDLIYLPELSFNQDKMLEDVKKIYDKKGRVVIAVSEGIRTKNGNYLIEEKTKEMDTYGHLQLGGVAAILADTINKKLNISTRAIELSLPQRCGIHFASKKDLDISEENGRWGIKYLLNGVSGKMINIDFINNEFTYNPIDLNKVANVVRKFPLEWIKEDNDISDEFINYIKPLIEGEIQIPFKNGLPYFVDINRKILN